MYWDPPLCVKTSISNIPFIALAELMLSPGNYIWFDFIFDFVNLLLGRETVRPTIYRQISVQCLHWQSYRPVTGPMTGPLWSHDQQFQPTDLLFSTYLHERLLPDCTYKYAIWNQLKWPNTPFWITIWPGFRH